VITAVSRRLYDEVKSSLCTLRMGVGEWRYIPTYSFCHKYIGLVNKYKGYSVYVCVCVCVGARGRVVAKALRYKPAGRGFYSRWCHIFQ
jgi:hypothetical protein